MVESFTMSSCMFTNIQTTCGDEMNCDMAVWWQTARHTSLECYLMVVAIVWVHVDTTFRTGLVLQCFHYYYHSYYNDAVSTIEFIVNDAKTATSNHGRDCSNAFWENLEFFLQTAVCVSQTNSKHKHGHHHNSLIIIIVGIHGTWFATVHA
jgi:hypothetical protein